MFLNYPSWWSSVNSDLWSLRGQIFTQVNIIPAFAGAFLDMGGVCRFLTDSQLSGEQKCSKHFFNTDNKTVMYFFCSHNMNLFSFQFQMTLFCGTQKEMFCRMVMLLFSVEWKSIVKKSLLKQYDIFFSRIWHFCKKLKGTVLIKMKFLTSFTHIHVVPTLYEFLLSGTLEDIFNCFYNFIMKINEFETTLL